jgi:hypothetical protein
MSEEDRRRENWFEKMDGFLDWKIISPDLFSPFRPLLTDIKIQELAFNKNALKRMIDLRCLCDGHEVLLIKNARSPAIKTDHPCIAVLTKDEILQHIEEQGHMARIEHEVERIQKILQEEITQRDQEEMAKFETRKKAKKKDKEKRKDNSGYRIIRK